MSFKFESGFDAADKVIKEAEARAALREAEDKAGGRFYRFFFKAGEERNIVFLDSTPPIVKEHGIKLNGKWGNNFTCLSAIDEPCPICKMEDRPTDVGFFTILDLTPFTDKKGNRRTASVKVFAAKTKVLAQLKKFHAKYASRGGLVGKSFEVSRSSDKAASTGDVFIPGDEYTTKQLLDIINANRKDPVVSLDAVRPNWREYLAPKSAADLAVLLGGKADEPDDDEEAEVNFS